MSEQEKSTRPAMSLAEMREIDIKTVDRNSLVDMNTVKIDPALPQKERMQEFIRRDQKSLLLSGSGNRRKDFLLW